MSVANENVSLVISRQILSEFCSCFSSLPDAVGKDVAHFTLDKVQPRVVSFEEQVGRSTEIVGACCRSRDHDAALSHCWCQLFIFVEVIDELLSHSCRTTQSVRPGVSWSCK